MQIADNIHFLEAKEWSSLGTHGPNVFLVGRERMVMVDAGEARESAVQAKLGYLEGLGSVSLTDILITHCHLDHIGGTAGIRATTGAKLRAHRLEAPAVNSSLQPERLDVLLEDGDCVKADGSFLRVIHTPGHTTGHLCFFLADEGILFTGDLVVGTGTTMIGPPLGDMAHYLGSLRKLLDLDLKLICPGHGPLVKEPRQRIHELIEHRLEREAQIASFLSQQAKTPEELLRDIYPELDDRLHRLAWLTVMGHLQKLEEEGRIFVLEGDKESRYALR